MENIDCTDYDKCPKGNEIVDRIKYDTLSLIFFGSAVEICFRISWYAVSFVFSYCPSFDVFTFGTLIQVDLPL